MGAFEAGRQDPDKQTILIADDSSLNRAILRDAIKDDFNIIEASDGKEAISVLHEKNESIDLVLLDNIMPNMTGIEVVQVMNSNGWIATIPVIMISADTSSDSVNEAFDLGVTDFISRPFVPNIVLSRIKNTLMLFDRHRALVDMIEDQILAREKSVRLMVLILSQIVEFRNGESGLHVQNVNVITEMLLKRLADKTTRYDIDDDAISRITLASSLHDIGKMSIPEEILNKPGRLTDEEFQIMKTHSAAGAEMLDKLSAYKSDPLIETAYEICRWHHERYDGRGYPDGLKGDEIPISAQVVSLADVYDALISERVYKEAFSHEKAVQMILGGECGTFNPIILECLTDIADDLQERLEAASESDEAYLKGANQAVAKAAIMAASTGETPTPSSRTLELLEHERVKTDFYAMMSNEVLFEYTDNPSLVTFVDYSGKQLGLPEIVKHPYEDEQMIAMFGEENLQRLFESLRNTTKDNPIIQLDFKALVENEPRWLHVAARAMWRETSDGPVYQGSIGKIVDIHEDRQRITVLEKQAMHDSLTGLMHHDFARKLVLDRMQANPRGNFALVLVDLDHFKDANDTYGHMFGDEVLKFLATNLKKSVRENDIVARVGGDEFTVCMECDNNPEPLIKRIFESITDIYEGFPVSISMGVSYVTGGFADYDDMFKAADDALYDVKRAGGNGYRLVAQESTRLGTLSLLPSTIVGGPLATTPGSRKGER